MGWTESIAKALSNIGIIYDKKNDKEEALRYLNQGLELFKQIGSKIDIEQTEYNIQIIKRQSR